MHDILRERILRKLDNLPESQVYQILDYIEFIEARYAKAEAIAVAAIEGLAARAVLVIDLLLNWCDTSEGPLRTVRLRSDRFDARALVTGEERTSDALRAFAAALLERCGAVPLPDHAAVRGRPFAVYESLASYEREVLQVER